MFLSCFPNWIRFHHIREGSSGPLDSTSCNQWTPSSNQFLCFGFQWLIVTLSNGPNWDATLAVLCLTIETGQFLWASLGCSQGRGNIRFSNGTSQKILTNMCLSLLRLFLSIVSIRDKKGYIFYFFKLIFGTFPSFSTLTSLYKSRGRRQMPGSSSPLSVLSFGIVSEYQKQQPCFVFLCSSVAERSMKKCSVITQTLPAVLYGAYNTSRGANTCPCWELPVAR
jgi:hypothetical protein